MAYRVSPAHDETNQVEFEIPIKGRQNPLFFTVPKLQYIPRDKADEFEVWLEANPKGSEKLVTLKLLEILLPTKTFETVSRLTNGEILDLSAHWNEVSKVTVPE